MERNYYTILGVQPGAAPEDIKRAYRRLARRYHPDAGRLQPVEGFHEIQRAYDTLSDDRQRERYDRELASASEISRERFAGPTMAAPVRPVSAFFDEIAIDFPSVTELLERMRSTFLRSADPPREMRAEIELTAAEARAGVRVPLEVPVARPCPRCDGRGEWVFDPCRRCGGAGFVETRVPVSIDLPPGIRSGSRLGVQLRPRGTAPICLSLSITVR